MKQPNELLHKYLEGKASREEIAIVEQWYASLENESVSKVPDDGDLPVVKERIYQQLLTELGSPVSVVPLYKRPSFRAAAAVIIFCLLSISSFLFYSHNNHAPVVTLAKQKPANDVVPPASNKAILTLSDGSKIMLDSTGAGNLAVQGSVNVVKQDDGLISYNGMVSTKENVYNTLTVPKGSKPMKVLLADGSLVWLNVASSITYPIAFSGHERKVEITGEAYFEVAKNKNMPFVVARAGDDSRVQVLGTHFNVNAYDDEAEMKVTLLEGAVDVSKSGNHKILNPGQQAMITSADIKLASEVDMEEVMAWKEGRFFFDGARIETVMRQLEKWYNIQVVYQAGINYSFVAKISRDVNISDILTILERTELVHFNIEGTKITVLK